MRRIRIRAERLCNDDAFVCPGYRLKTTDRAKYGIEIVHGDVFYPNVAVYKPDGKLLFVLLKGVLKKELCNDAYKLLKKVNGDPSNRPGIIGERAQMSRIRQDGKLSPRLAVPKAVLKKFGGKADMLGYYRYKNPKPGVPQCEPTAWTVRDLETYTGILPFIREVDEVYRTCLPKAYAVQMRYVSQVPDNFKITGTAFTTLYVIKNAPTAFHTDDFDYEESFGVMASLGNWRGNEICFPKFRVGVDYRPGDVLLADVHEMHGNFPLLSGERVACVFFVRKGMDGCGRLGRETGRECLPALSSKNEPARQPRVWDCHAGKHYPEDAEYVGCRVTNRKGVVIREGSIFGNGANPLVSHKGALRTESEFRAHAIEKLNNPAFRAEAEKLRGRDLLCWCVQDGPKRADFCHARVWLELINQEQRRDFDWGYYEPNFLTKAEADALFKMAKGQLLPRPIIPRNRRPLRRIPGTCWSVRDRYADSVGMVPLAEAPAEIISLQRKLSDLAGKDVNYFSLQAYENQEDHILWHQHRVKRLGNWALCCRATRS